MTNTKGMDTTKQTAVDLMFQKAMLVLPMGSIDARQALKETYEEAKEMHKKEIKDAIFWGNIKGYDEHKRTWVFDEDEQYYNETYGGKK
jgi:hypothetical protein